MAGSSKRGSRLPESRRRASAGVPLRIGVDTGGTFTDFVCLAPDGSLRVEKLRSTPADPSQAFFDGVARLARGNTALEVAHGSTVATNAVLERKGAKVALLTTAGFEDALAIGRQSRPALYDFFVAPRPSLVDSRLVFGVSERLDATGAVLIPLDLRAVDRIAARLVRSGAEIVAVCFLHSHANPGHEKAAADRLRRAGLAVCLSSEVLPEHREFERWSAAVVNASVTPIMDRYLGRLESGLAGSRLRVMHSNGGSLSAAAARERPVRAVLSGPAAGVVGAGETARAAGFSRIISFDMGGTSTDVSLIDDRIAMTTESVIGDFPIRLPMIDIHTVGAGGGSIASVDSGGALRVGPQSAGADPGPACYGKGTDFTVTDANLFLGRMDPEYFLGGRMALDIARAKAAASPIARLLAIGEMELAEAVARVANANMERAIRVVSLERGHDPRDFALLAFGGAGGMHACDIAAQLEIGVVIAPRHAGVLSALGALMADVVKDYSTSILRETGSMGAADIAARFEPLVATARHDLAAEGFAPARRRIERLVEMRYAGQSHEITVPFSRDCRREFDRLHQRAYGHSNPARPTEIVNARVVARGVTEKPGLPRSREVASRARPGAIRPARFDGRERDTGIYRWDDLSPGAFGLGPAVVAGAEATVVIPPGFVFRVDGFGNVIARQKKPARRGRIS
jgi:N-methylhydantoinase A/oxoprolinase/acetone carboxylase beta subunit